MKYFFLSCIIHSINTSKGVIIKCKNKVRTMFKRLIRFFKNILGIPDYERFGNTLNSFSDDELQDLEMYCNIVTHNKDMHDEF